MEIGGTKDWLPPIVLQDAVFEVDYLVCSTMEFAQKMS
jgi:hypothetical protein